jgi:histidinol-phosphate aminotransferase
MTYQRPNIASMRGYSWGEQPDNPETIKLNTNENPYPPSPKVGEALAALDVGALRTYPPPTADPLRDKLARLHRLNRDNIVMTHGGDEGLRLAFTTFVEPGAPFGMAEPSYSLYPVLADIHGSQTVKIALDDDWQLPRSFATQLNEAGANLACIVNPHAPSGTLLDADRLSRIANDFNGVLLVDEAYVDFVDPSLQHDVTKLISVFDNLLVLRTFSKGYSLAGLRLGYLVGHKSLIDPLLHKTRDSYNVDLISQALGAAAIDDQAHAESTWAKVRQNRRSLREALIEQGFKVWQSQTNFLLAEAPLSLPCNAAEIYQALKARDVLVRYFDTPDLDDKLRITVGTPEENAHLLSHLAEIIGSRK